MTTIEFTLRTANQTIELILDNNYFSQMEQDSSNSFILPQFEDEDEEYQFVSELEEFLQENRITEYSIN